MGEEDEEGTTRREDRTVVGGASASSFRSAGLLDSADERELRFRFFGDREASDD